VGAVAERSDRELLAAVADHDRGALRELHARHAPWVTSRLRRRCADGDVIAEAVQDTFVAAWKSASDWSGTGEPAAWLWGIAIRRLIGVLRSRRRWGPAIEIAAEEQGVMIAAEEQVLLGIEHGDLAGALGGLSPELRAVVQATVLDGLTTREAGRLLGIPAGTVKTRMMRAKAELRGALA
jgi:RNA polymerase sigma-70 factor (ECF subfamily)